MASEVNAVVNLVVKATSFLAQLQDGWYKGSVELDTLQSKLWVLRARHGQWNEQLQKYGISEDKYILPLVEEAAKALEIFQNQVAQLQKSSLRRWKKKVFPGQLLFLVNKIFEIVDAGPQLLATTVANNDQLERYLRQTPAQLPFGPDLNYVPNTDSILAVRNTLENSEGPRVVTVYGGPGMGKSSLLKYLAIQYQEEQKRLRADASFPHGVYYLFCGQHAGKRVTQLLLELLGNLGYGTGCVAPNDSHWMCSGLQEEDYISLRTNQIKLRSRLAEQKLLIMLDDLWELKVLLELLVPAKEVKYLVTSQMRDICSTAGKIQITEPTLRECRQIMANYTDGLAKTGEFPQNIESVADGIIRMLQYHPLSLANTGISINRSRATDIKQWDVIKKHIYVHLDENESHSPAAYDRPYSLSVSASMMLMVESLPAEAQRLLFLMALLEGRELPESLVKYFYSFIQKDNFVLKYNKHERCLQDKSLIELKVRADGSILDIHRLRAHCIRERKSPELRLIGSQILAFPEYQDVAKLIRTGNAEETLVTFLSAMYYDQSLRDVVAGTLGNHVSLINDGVIPRSLTTETDTLDLVESVRRKHFQIQDLVWLLNADHEEDNWKREAHELAKKIIIKFVCQGKLEDNSMALLLRLPQTTSAACGALRALSRCHAVDFIKRNLNFSEAYAETMQALLDLFENNAISLEERTDVITTLLLVLDYESKDYIRKFAAKYQTLLAMNFDNNFLHALTYALGRRGMRTMAEFPGILESLFAVLEETGNDEELREEASHVICDLCEDIHLAMKIAALPEALKTLFHSFLSDDSLSALQRELRGNVGEALYCLSFVPENRTKVGATEGIWNGLAGILTELEEVWWAIREDDDLRSVEELARVAAGVLGSLALEKDHSDTIHLLPDLRSGLLFLQLIETVRTYTRPLEYSDPGSHVFTRFNSTRALITLYSEAPGDPRSADLPGIQDVLNVVLSHPGAAPSTTSSMDETCYLSLSWTRVLVYMQMGSYAEALNNLDVYLIPKLDMWDPQYVFSSLRLSESNLVFSPYCGLFRDARIFLQAMLGDYAGALLGANRRVQENYRRVYLAERGVLKRLAGDLQGALADLDAASVGSFQIWAKQVLWQRGYVKYLMDDTVGAKDDAETAQRYAVYTTYRETSLEFLLLCKIPVTYLGYSKESFCLRVIEYPVFPV